MTWRHDKGVKRFLKGMFIAMGVLVLLIGAINLYVIKSTEKYVYQQGAQLPNKQAVLILGAGVRGKSLSLVLQDRVFAGMDIYKKGYADKILLSGDHGRVNYDEVNAMRLFVLSHAGGKVAEEDLFMDHAGFDTYDSMVRAKKVFCAKSLIIVTQSFHINRAVYLARAMGIDAIGVAVNEDDYFIPYRLSWNAREILARTKAFANVLIHSKPKFLGAEIPLSGDGRKTWD